MALCESGMLVIIELADGINTNTEIKPESDYMKI